MREYKITNVQRKDEWSSKYGPMVSFDIALEGEQGWIRLNQKLETPEPQVGWRLTGEITNEMQGEESYRKFKKINPKYAGEQPQQQSQANSQESYIVQMLEELTGRRNPVELPIDKVIDDPFNGMNL